MARQNSDPPARSQHRSCWGAGRGDLSIFTSVYPSAQWHLCGAREAVDFPRAVGSQGDLTFALTKVAVLSGDEQRRPEDHAGSGTSPPQPHPTSPLLGVGIWPSLPAPLASWVSLRLIGFHFPFRMILGMVAPCINHQGLPLMKQPTPPPLWLTRLPSGNSFLLAPSQEWPRPLKILPEQPPWGFGAVGEQG